MNFDLDKTVDQIINHKYFQLTKRVVENNENHKDDPVYEHQIRTFEKAKETIKGDLITNPEAKEEFEKLKNSEIDGIKKEHLLQIVSLLHDIGKIMVFVDGDKNIPLFQNLPNGKTSAPLHEYWGSVLVKEMLSDLDLPPAAIDYVSNCIRIHNTGFNYWSEDISNEKRLFEIKLRSENLHFEIIFGTYCDLFYGNGFKNQLHLPIEVLNLPETYQNISYKTI